MDNSHQETQKMSYDRFFEQTPKAHEKVCLFCHESLQKAEREECLDIEYCMFCHKPVENDEDPGYYTPDNREN